MALASGITLIEMMIVVAILAVLLALAAPNISEFFIRNRLDTAANELMTAFAFARSEAMRRGVPVSVRRLSTTSQNWGEGWEIFVDPNKDGVRGSGEELLRVGPRLSPPLTLRSSMPVEGSVPFTADGRVDRHLYDAIGSASPGCLGECATFVFCYGNVLRDGTRSRSRVVIINSPGRARMGVDANNNGIPEDFGSDITTCTP